MRLRSLARIGATAASACMLFLAAGPAAADTNVRFRIDIGNAPPPPRYVTYDRYDPDWVVVPGTDAYWWGYGDDDIYRYGGSYYVLRNGYWYRGPSMRGPFRVVAVRTLPRVVIHADDYRYQHRNGWAAHRYYGDRGRDGRWADRNDRRWKNRGHDNGNHGRDGDRGRDRGRDDDWRDRDRSRRGS